MPRRARTSETLSVGLFLLLGLGCEAPALPASATSTGAGGADVTPTASEKSATYYGAVAPLIEQHCKRCHQAGGGAPIALSDWAQVEPIADVLVDEVLSFRMPPFVPRAGCRELTALPLMSDDERTSLERWRDTGFPEGDPSEYVAPAAPTPAIPLGPPTLVLPIPAPYLPPPGDSENEWSIDYAFPADTWVVASELAPSATAFVHHANAFVELGSAPPDVPAPTSILGAWAPGFAPLRFPEGSAFMVPAGARIMIAVHYSTLLASPQTPLVEDRTELRLWTLPPGELPASQAFFDPINVGELFLPAFAENVEVYGDTPLGLWGAPIVGVMPHMHLLGASFRAEVEHADGEVSCLIDLPSYEFRHQALWLFDPTQRVEVAEGDRHRMTCVYDNSQANQPFIEGQQSLPVDVAQGGKSTDEMCMNGLLRIAPLR